MLWRRSYDTPPPPISDTNEFSQADDPRYAELGDDAPKTECLADVVTRMEPYLNGPIFDDLRAGHTVLVAAHGNSLRAVVKLLDGISDEGIAKVNLPTGIPLQYDLDADMRPIKAGGTYLDPEAAAAAITAVANQGR
jgi:2,3-bisphosphoglycerate-dependent phosphoglycerate mutase